MTTFERLKKQMVECRHAPEEKITEEACFIEDLGMDSLDLVECVMAIEEEFGVEILDAEAEMCLTVGDAVKMIDWHRQAYGSQT